MHEPIGPLKLAHHTAGQGSRAGKGTWHRRKIHAMIRCASLTLRAPERSLNRNCQIVLLTRMAWIPSSAVVRVHDMPRFNPNNNFQSAPSEFSPDSTTQAGYVRYCLNRRQQLSHRTPTKNTAWTTSTVLLACQRCILLWDYRSLLSLP